MDGRCLNCIHWDTKFYAVDKPNMGACLKHSEIYDKAEVHESKLTKIDTTECAEGPYFITSNIFGCIEFKDVDENLNVPFLGDRINLNHNKNKN